MIATGRSTESSTGSNTRSRINWYLRVIPATVLAWFYIGIAVFKGRDAVESTRAIANGAAVTDESLVLLYSLSGAIFFAILGIMMFVRKEPVRREKRIIGWVLPFAVMAFLAYVGGAPLQDHGTPLMMLATALVVIGTAFTIYALRHLGRHFGVVSDVRGLVTSGPYHWVRHPLYAGETITIIGLVIAVANPLTVTMFAIGLALQVVRAKVEEQSLTAAFPEYADYAARTPMLIPLPKLR
jgi:protein-S-isoprenylcysteine O-methyltransferase Ste14